MHVLNRTTITEQSMYCTICWEEFSFIIGCNFDLIDPIAAIAVIVIIIEIDYELNNVNSRIEMDNGIGYNWCHG